MTLYTHFIGIDIGKNSFVVAVYDRKGTEEYANSSAGIRAFLKAYKTILKQGLCVLEPTGGYEMECLLTLCDKGIAVHRADTRKVKNFIRSYGNDAKTDALDAKALACYGHERYAGLALFTPQSTKALELYQLVQRRHDLKQMLVAEKNRLQAPRNAYVKDSCAAMVKALSEQISLVTAQINVLIDADEGLKHKREILTTIPGIGSIIANDLLILLPELGTLNRKQIASLTGLAPRANDSGSFKGYRATSKRGRCNIKPILFMAAMSARNSHSHLKDFYQKLITNGKRKMVALVALMRKIIVIANAKLKHLCLQTT